MNSLIENKKKETKVNCTNDREITKFADNKPVKKKRTCLMCNKLFYSKGASNRRCPSCNRSLSLGRSRDFYSSYVYRFAGGLEHLGVDDSTS